MINLCFFIQHVKVCIDSPLLSHLLGTFLFCHLLTMLACSGSPWERCSADVDAGWLWTSCGLFVIPACLPCRATSISQVIVTLATGASATYVPRSWFVSCPLAYLCLDTVHVGCDGDILFLQPKAAGRFRCCGLFLKINGSKSCLEEAPVNLYWSLCRISRWVFPRSWVSRTWNCNREGRNSYWNVYCCYS